MKRVIVRAAEAFRKECNRCGCHFEYDLDDIEKNNEVSGQDKVSCPECGKEFYHDGKWDRIKYQDEIDALDF